ncbi:hypothetical protein pb186bvf_006024 [Paramecium bursaria]
MINDQIEDFLLIKILNYQVLPYILKSFRINELQNFRRITLYILNILNMNADLKIKVVIIGDVGVGKTSITNVFVSESFDVNEKSTCGAAFQTKICIYENSKFTFQVSNDYIFQIWDTAGQEKYQSLISLYYKDAQVALLVFDITDPKSFERINIWVNDLRDRKDELIMILVGNKSDLTGYQQVGYDQIKSYADSQNCEFRIVSAKTNEGIQDLFQFVAQKVQNHQPQAKSEMKKTNSYMLQNRPPESQKDQKKFGCC